MKKLGFGLPLVLAGLLIIILLCGGLIGLGVTAYGYINGLRSEQIARETGLNEQYLANQAELSGYVTAFYEQIGVANLKSDQMDRIIEDAVKGRYDDDTAANPTQGAMFSAIVEAYPDLDLEIYDEIAAFVREKRDAYKNNQTTLLGLLQDYDQWRKEDLIRSMVLKYILRAPSDALEARIGSQIWRGQAALDHMYLIVLDSQTVKAYETGILDPLPVPGVSPGN